MPGRPFFLGALPPEGWRFSLVPSLAGLGLRLTYGTGDGALAFDLQRRWSGDLRVSFFFAARF